MAFINGSFELGRIIPDDWHWGHGGYKKYAPMNANYGAVETFFWEWPGENDISELIPIGEISDDFEFANYYTEIIILDSALFYGLDNESWELTYYTNITIAEWAIFFGGIFRESWVVLGWIDPIVIISSVSEGFESGWPSI